MLMNSTLALCLHTGPDPPHQVYVRDPDWSRHSPKVIPSPTMVPVRIEAAEQAQKQGHQDAGPLVAMNISASLVNYARKRHAQAHPTALFLLGSNTLRSTPSVVCTTRSAPSIWLPLLHPSMRSLATDILPRQPCVQIQGRR